MSKETDAMVREDKRDVWDEWCSRDRESLLVVTIYLDTSCISVDEKKYCRIVCICHITIDGS